MRSRQRGKSRRIFGGVFWGERLRAWFRTWCCANRGAATPSLQPGETFCASLALIDAPEGTASLAQRLMDERIVPSTEPEDAAHIAIATLIGAKYLSTWNFAHFASPEAKYRVVIALSQWGYDPPLIVTPEELLEEFSQ